MSPTSLGMKYYGLGQVVRDKTGYRESAKTFETREEALNYAIVEALTDPDLRWALEPVQVKLVFDEKNQGLDYFRRA